MIEYTQDCFANLLIMSSRKTHNSQSLDSRNQNPTYGILQCLCITGIVINMTDSLKLKFLNPKLPLCSCSLVALTCCIINVRMHSWAVWVHTSDVVRTGNEPPMLQ